MLERIAPELRERLGPEATAGLVALLLQSRREMTADVVSIAGERFERRLAEETSKLRVDMAAGFEAVRRELMTGLTALRLEIATGHASLHQDIQDQRFEILKWVFLFWVGQFFAVASVLAVAIRFLKA